LARKWTKLGQTGPHRAVLCASDMSGARPGQLANWLLLGIHRDVLAVIHQTVRCAPDTSNAFCGKQLSGSATVGDVINAEHVSAMSAGNGRKGVPDMSGASPKSVVRPQTKGNHSLPNGGAMTPWPLGAIKEDLGRLCQYNKHS
jgi:hypothetical protein